MKISSPLSQAIVAKNLETIEKIIQFYAELNLPAYIRIETGTYDRLIITPVWMINIWFQDKKTEKIAGINRDEFFAKCLNPYTLCSQMVEKKSEYCELLYSLPVYTGLIAIDYEAENIREVFDPVVISLRN